jgi:hypothetical protein
MMSLEGGRFGRLVRRDPGIFMVIRDISAPSNRYLAIRRGGPGDDVFGGRPVRPPGATRA